MCVCVIFVAEGFNNISQLHVSARPSGAIFKLHFFKKVICKLTMLVDYEISYFDNAC